jgi:hypothetical protein
MGSVSEALALLLQVTNTALVAMSNAQQISTMIQKAQAAGRTNFTPEEWQTIQGIDNAARQQLVQAITAALQK